MEKKKSVGGTNEKVSSYIHDDIALSILSKLPFKSLKRFECVSKSWSLLFKNHHFMNMFRNNLHVWSYDKASLLLQVEEPDATVLYSLSRERFENKIKLDFSNPFGEECLGYQIFGLGSSNGTLCLHQEDFCKFILWNPTTNELNPIPHSPVESYIPDAAKDFVAVVSCLHGFGYEHGTCDYKVIRRIFFRGIGFEDWPYVPSRDEFEDEPLVPLWEIYSLRSNLWKKLDVEMPGYLFCIEGMQVDMDGFCHWVCKDDSPIVPCMVSFDLSNEVFFTTPIPTDVDDYFDVGPSWIHLVVLNESIAMISYHRKMTTFHISLLGEPGVKESWTELFIFGPLSCVYRPIGVGPKGEIFFITKDNEIAWFDLSTQMVKELHYKYKTNCLHSRMIIYKESLLPIGGISS